MEPETGLDLGDASGFMGFPAFNQKDLNALEPLIRDFRNHLVNTPALINNCIENGF